MLSVIRDFSETASRVRDEVFGIADGLPVGELRERATRTRSRLSEPASTLALSSHVGPRFRAEIWREVLMFAEESGTGAFSLEAYLRTRTMPRGFYGNLMFPAGRPSSGVLFREKMADLRHGKRARR
jgi:hypothetical protein